MSLIKTWLSIQCGSGEPISHALDDLFEHTGIRITHSRLREWERADRGMPVEAINYMMKAALFKALRENGIHVDISDELNDSITNMLTIPIKK